MSGRERGGVSEPGQGRVAEPDQSEAPLVEALRAYRERRMAAFHTPGHKLGAGAPPDLVDALGERLLSADMGIANGLDDTQESGGLLARAEALAALAWGADHSFFVGNGSSGGLQALVMAVAGPGDEVIVPRNAHKALLAGLIFSGAMPVYVEPTFDPTWQVAVNVPLERFAAAIEEHPRARAVFVTSPSYNGFCADVAGLAAAAHAAGLPLVVDQAWGAHLRFSTALPTDALAADADAAVISVHKLLAGLSQASIVLARGARVDPDRLRGMVAMLRTTSPLAPIYVSIDAARRQMLASGEALWGEALSLATRARERLGAIPGVTVLGAGGARQPGAADFDPVRLTLSLATLGLSGYELERRLRTDHALAVEAADPHNVVVNITFGDSLGDGRPAGGCGRRRRGAGGPSEWRRSRRGRGGGSEQRRCRDGGRPGCRGSSRKERQRSGKSGVTAIAALHASGLQPARRLLWPCGSGESGRLRRSGERRDGRALPARNTRARPRRGDLGRDGGLPGRGGAPRRAGPRPARPDAGYLARRGRRPVDAAVARRRPRRSLGPSRCRGAGAARRAGRSAAPGCAARSACGAARPAAGRSRPRPAGASGGPRPECGSSLRAWRSGRS